MGGGGGGRDLGGGPRLETLRALCWLQSVRLHWLGHLATSGEGLGLLLRDELQLVCRGIVLSPSPQDSPRPDGRAPHAVGKGVGACTGGSVASISGLEEGMLYMYSCTVVYLLKFGSRSQPPGGGADSTAVRPLEGS